MNGRRIASTPFQIMVAPCLSGETISCMAGLVSTTNPKWKAARVPQGARAGDYVLMESLGFCLNVVASSLWLLSLEGLFLIHQSTVSK